MADDKAGTGLDLVRWTFTAQPERRQAIIAYLSDLGVDVAVAADGHLVAIWDEPDADVDFDAVVDELWALNETPFELTHEEFGRSNLEVYEADDEGEARAA